MLRDGGFAIFVVEREARLVLVACAWLGGALYTLGQDWTVDRYLSSLVPLDRVDLPS